MSTATATATTTTTTTTTTLTTTAATTTTVTNNDDNNNKRPSKSALTNPSSTSLWGHAKQQYCEPHQYNDYPHIFQGKGFPVSRRCQLGDQQRRFPKMSGLAMTRAYFHRKQQLIWDVQVSHFLPLKFLEPIVPKPTSSSRHVPSMSSSIR